MRKNNNDSPKNFTSCDSPTSTTSTNTSTTAVRVQRRSETESPKGFNKIGSCRVNSIKEVDLMSDMEKSAPEYQGAQAQVETLVKRRQGRRF
ncbi:hypothetical protein JTB14_007625 [Gonioctena quinquepunctata]|nr:hypothetical protein JTB14_007625 [Gonioctena quinquepunctata]